MQWWNSFVDWWYSEDGQQVLVSAVIPFVAIAVSGLIGALIGRGATRRLVMQRDRETRVAAVSALISAGQNASRWHSQTPAAREHAERLANDADVMVRLLPIAGSRHAADWASHQLAEMRTNSVSYSYPAEQTLDEYRERLVLWLHKPGKARKFFAADLERWRYEERGVDPLIAEQQEWAEAQFTASEPAGSAVAGSASQGAADPEPETAAPEPAIPDPADRYSTPLAPSVTSHTDEHTRS